MIFYVPAYSLGFDLLKTNTAMPGSCPWVYCTFRFIY